MCDALRPDRMESRFCALYGADAPRQAERYRTLTEAFQKAFGSRRAPALFSAPGRSEIGGNHTDHQQGKVLAAAVTLDMIAAALPRKDGVIHIHSAGYRPMRLSLDALEKRGGEKNTSYALVRGIASRLRELGYQAGGFDAVISSEVPKGSGLSSSAAYSILLCTIFSGLYNGGGVSPVEQALISQYAENVYFGKPSGLMDQLACATGGFAAMDFQNPQQPIVRKIDCDLAAHGYGICIVSPGGSHARLTRAYAAIPEEMGLVSAYFHKQCLREVSQADFHAAIPRLRKSGVPDRAILRAMHFFGEERRVVLQADALEKGDMETFRNLMIDSGRSSFMLLQNVCPDHPEERSIALALALSERLLAGKGAWRVHGGGFSGTIQALAPLTEMDAYRQEMERVFGKDCCYRLSVRAVGGVAFKG